MSQDLNACHLSPVSNNIITARGKLFYTQYLVKPDDNKWTSEICFQPNVDLTVLKNAMGAKALEGVEGDKNQARNFVSKRFIDPNNKPNGGKPAGDKFEGWTMIRAACSKSAPDFAYPNGQKINPEDVEKECYSGRFARLTVNPYWLDKDITDDSGKKIKIKGIFIGLVNVQLLDHDEPMGFVKAAVTEEFGDSGIDVTGGSSSTDTKSSADDEQVQALDALF